MNTRAEEKLKLSVPFWCSVRVIITFVGFLGMMVHFSQKTNISIALVCMVNHSAIEQHGMKTSSTKLNQQCLASNKTISIHGSYNWSKNTQGILLSAYFGGYILTQIPAGYIAGRYGARILFSGAIFTSSLITVFMPAAAGTHWFLFSVFQIFVGLAHGTIWPCMVVTMAHWAPANERGKLMGFMNAGAQIGNFLVLSTGGLMCSWNFAGGWPLIFYSVGTAGFLWAILWLIVYHDSPREHRYINEIEKNFILEHTRKNIRSKDDNSHTPWHALLTSSACWALFVIHTCSNWGTYTFLTSIPKYMDEVLGFDIKSNGILSALPYGSQWLVINLSGVLADLIIRRKILTVTQTRKLFTVLGNFIPALLVLSLAFMTCRLKYVAVLLLTIGVALSGCCFGGGYILVANDIAPAYAGIVFGISNTFATIPGIVSPYIVGTLTEKDPNNWRIVFFICAGIYTIGVSIFLWFGSSELQSWAVRNRDNSILPDNLLSKSDNDTTV
ncbi:unnamed protein product [Adineta ricciae]|uniref:Major facilitator superfamily (MFS) profile domain-containing protein n=1 Tax=Adineta ricciae TaxID=249248 RepID=A0A814J3K3_ADIRI|nr:unnamed protein product [Adineta ricciae]